MTEDEAKKAFELVQRLAFLRQKLKDFKCQPRSKLGDEKAIVFRNLDRVAIEKLLERKAHNVYAIDIPPSVWRQIRDVFEGNIQNQIALAENELSAMGRSAIEDKMMEILSRDPRLIGVQFTDREHPPEGVCQCKNWSAHVHESDDIVTGLEVGDWIVPAPDGKHYYAVQDGTFKKRHEPA